MTPDLTQDEMDFLKKENLTYELFVLYYPNNIHRDSFDPVAAPMCGGLVVPSDDGGFVCLHCGEAIPTFDDYHIEQRHKYCEECGGECIFTDGAAEHHGHKEHWRDWKKGDYPFPKAY